MHPVGSTVAIDQREKPAVLVKGKVSGVETRSTDDLGVYPRPEHKEVKGPFDSMTVLRGEKRGFAGVFSTGRTGLPESFVNAERDMKDFLPFVTHRGKDFVMPFPENDCRVTVL